MTKYSTMPPRGFSKTRLHSIWNSMRARCLNVNHKDYARYGGRGITICPRWLRGEHGKHPFLCMWEDMGDPPTSKHSIDRRDNEKGYYRENCGWATPLEQARNRRPRYQSPPRPVGSQMIAILGVTRTMDEWCEVFSISKVVAQKRLLSGWDPEIAFITPRLVEPRTIYFQNLLTLTSD